MNRDNNNVDNNNYKYHLDRR